MTPPAACRLRGQTGQAALLMLGVLAGLLTGVLVLGSAELVSQAFATLSLTGVKLVADGAASSSIRRAPPFAKRGPAA